MKRLLSYSRGLDARLLCGFVVVALLSAMLATLLNAEISDAAKKKRDAFIKAREEMRAVASPTPAKSSSGKPKAVKKRTKGGSGKSSQSGKKKTSSSKKKKAAVDKEEDETPRRASTPRPTPEETATPRRVAPAATAPARELPPADITIQKSGLEEEQGFEPPPPPPPRGGFWSRVFGGREPSYRYLSRNVIAAIRRAPVQRARWKFIIVHNSGTRQGNARAFDYYHKRVRRMKNGLAYHFVVGNGRSSGDGEVEVGDRWRRQINGGHVHSDYLNNISLGICLVGDFNRDQPTRAQLEATEELIRYLRERCGKADGRSIPVRPHREMNPPRWATDCPGDDFPYGWFRRF